jgi:predicted glycoside hydrolase/deacetylase ChbG (UPF0249 family)
MIPAMSAAGSQQRPPSLVITADDYGYRRAYDAGIVMAARAGALDRISVMATRDFDPAPLLELDVGIGIHLEPDPGLAVQFRAFEEHFGRMPDHIDGHLHCHAEPRFAPDIALVARELRVPVRAVSPPHRAQLREAGVITTDRLVGRLFEHQIALPLEIGRWLVGERIPEGSTEWLVHPGLRDPASGSSYDAGRPEDLALLLELGDRERWRRAGIVRSASAGS